MTTEGALGEPQIIRIPENTFEYPLHLMLNLLLHEMIHVAQKRLKTLHDKKRERIL
jgi:predicted metal-dependent peptidase